MIDQRTAPWATLLLRVTWARFSLHICIGKFAILPGGPKHVVGQFLQQTDIHRSPVVLHIAEFVGAILFYPGYLDPLGSRCTHFL